MAGKVSANGELGGGKPTPEIHRENLDRRSKLPTPEKEDQVQVVEKDEFPFLDMKMSWSPEGDLQFGVFRKKGQQLILS